MRKKDPLKLSKPPRKSKNEARQAIANGLTEAILGFNPASLGTPINQVTTLFVNNRWYLVSNMRQLLSEIYCEHGIVQTVVDVPVDDALRGGVEIKTKELAPDEIEEIRVEMEDQDDLGTVADGAKWTRLFGGGGVIIFTDQPPNTPLNIDSLHDKRLQFRGVDMWELFWTLQNTGDYGAAIDGNQLESEFFNYYGVQVHRSRVMVMRGIKAPSFLRPRLRGWGLSIMEPLVNSINQYLKSNNLIFEVLDEFKIDVYKIKNLANTLLLPNGSEAVQRRLSLANQQKSFQKGVAMDSEDDFIQKELTFAGIAETMQGIRMQIASDLRMPLTKIFGISASGFSSGEDDIENYNSMVESQVRQKVKLHVLKMVSLRCMQKFGFVPDDLSIEFKPLRILTSEQQENVKTQQFQRLLQATQAGLTSVKEFKDACNKNNLIPIQLDTSLDRMEVSEGEGDENATDAPAGKPKKSVTLPKSAKNSDDVEASTAVN